MRSSVLTGRILRGIMVMAVADGEPSLSAYRVRTARSAHVIVY